MTDLRFPPQCRIRRSADYQRAYKRRSSAADPLIVVFGFPNDLPHARLGISASRRLGCAVVRNRWKRLLREAFRQCRSQLPQGVDLVVIPRPGVEPTLKALLESLPRLAGRVARKMP